MMKRTQIAWATLMALGLPIAGLAAASPALQTSKSVTYYRIGVQTRFETAGAFSFSPEQRTRIQSVLDNTHAAVRADFPDLAEVVEVTVVPVDRDLSSVGGVSGRADAPGRILIEISISGAGGADAAIADGLEPAFAHELHHLVRGWTMMENRFGPGIAIAAANEGLAVAYSEQLTGRRYAGNAPPADHVAESWALEIRDLPVNADYMQWMFAHPDGREGVGYRTGRYVVQQAMENSGQDAVALTEATPEEIWAMARLAD
ncbi:DUF2268 domain-containing putative Zn-dependent protease [Maricaulis parjimensis]|uniref:DUF2268 domain-containing putative Zn-dependent protease n=1 Tax=Maricaulis parjimensis TaxID=144023 RepID=UPI00193ACA60|nr:DUF2268 domain-containing putative Zn-dependent protease [Maricaulis parjimensis]